jgi:hypothetical protein
MHNKKSYYTLSNPRLSPEIERQDWKNNFRVILTAKTESHQVTPIHSIALDWHATGTLATWNFGYTVNATIYSIMSEQFTQRKKQFPFDEFEPKWQSIWEKDKTFSVPNPGDEGFDPAKPKYYVLDMFPYPSGSGLHVGHPEGYTATDIITRQKRMAGLLLTARNSLFQPQRSVTADRPG